MCLNRFEISITLLEPVNKLIVTKLHIGCLDDFFQDDAANTMALEDDNIRYCLHSL